MKRRGRPAGGAYTDRIYCDLPRVLTSVAPELITPEQQVPNRPDDWLIRLVKTHFEHVLLILARGRPAPRQDRHAQKYTRTSYEETCEWAFTEDLDEMRPHSLAWCCEVLERQVRQRVDPAAVRAALRRCYAPQKRRTMTRPRMVRVLEQEAPRE